MSARINISIKLVGLFGFLTVGAIIYSIGSYLNNDGIKSAGGIVLGIGAIIAVVLAYLSIRNRTNEFF